MLGAVLILIVIFSGIALITYVDNTTKAPRRAPLPKPDDPAALPPPLSNALPSALTPQALGRTAEHLTLQLPEPARTRAWNLLCAVIDAQRSTPDADTRTHYLLSQTRDAYLPDTLSAYLNLTEGSRQRLKDQGQPAETLLDEQLRLLEDGIHEAIRHDHAAADRLLTQGRFLRERFGTPESELALPSPSGKTT